MPKWRSYKQNKEKRKQDKTENNVNCWELIKEKQQQKICKNSPQNIIIEQSSTRNVKDWHKRMSWKEERSQRFVLGRDTCA